MYVKLYYGKGKLTVSSLIKKNCNITNILRFYKSINVLDDRYNMSFKTCEKSHNN